MNWFRKGEDGRFLWPGFGENSRVLKWIHQRCAEKVSGRETPIGILPKPGELDLDGLDLDDASIASLTEVDVEGWLAEIPLIREHYARFGGRLPADLLAELDALEKRLLAAR